RPPLSAQTVSLALHDALPIWARTIHGATNVAVWIVRVLESSCERMGQELVVLDHGPPGLPIRAACFDPTFNFGFAPLHASWRQPDRKSTRLNSSHEWNSYAVF